MWKRAFQAKGRAGKMHSDRGQSHELKKLKGQTRYKGEQGNCRVRERKWWSEQPRKDMRVVQESSCQDGEKQIQEAM